MIDTSPIRARCARLNLDSQDMGEGLDSLSGASNKRYER
ncbi:hypothetical protein STXM2123_1737 [Streptomyces sp. F-3]|nr:hypothetical protein STXM2123_1737 [Streptomyces sp. F-3]